MVYLLVFDTYHKRRRPLGVSYEEAMLLKQISSIKSVYSLNIIRVVQYLVSLIPSRKPVKRGPVLI